MINIILQIFIIILLKTNTNFLKENKDTKYYEDIHLIHSVITGQPPNDISHIEKDIMDDFEKIADKYDKIFKNKIKRKSFINSQYVLYQLLIKHKYPCKKRGF